MHVIERGSGTPVVLLHGFGVDHRILLPLDPVFEGWTRLYVDLPGSGGTPIGDVASAEDVARVVTDEIRSRVGDRPFALVGSSFGAMIARRIAHDLRPQVLGLATLAGVFVAEHDRRAVPPRTVLVADPTVDGGEDYAEQAVVQSPANLRVFVEHVLPGLRSADEVGLARIAERYGFDQEPEDAAPEPFTQPCLVVTGRQDDVVGYADAWARVEHYPRATFSTLDTAGHNVHLDRPGLVAALLTDWLERVVADARPAGRTEVSRAAPSSAT